MMGIFAATVAFRRRGHPEGRVCRLELLTPSLGTAKTLAVWVWGVTAAPFPFRVMPKYDAKQVAGLEQGDVLAGKYRIERVLGAGGMGVVIAAHHLQLDEQVAIKFLLPQMLEDSSSVSRFVREARAVVKIKSEHVARVLDVGTLDNGAPYMVMEFLDGADLAKWIEQRGPMPVEQAVEFVLQACVAVAEAHRLGIVHRDLKPANLFCVRRPDGQLAIKVLDFGISKLLRVDGAISDAVNATASLLGSPFYMSPEQMRSSGDLGAGTDIWALGVILYELLTGRVPFSGTTITEVATRVATQEPAPLRQRRPELPAGLEPVIARCLQKDRRDRYANVAELAMALQKFGPKRANAYVDRIVGTLEPRLEPTAISGGGWDRPPAPLSEGFYPLAPAGTIAPMGRTVPRGIGTKTGVIAMTLIVSVGAGAAAALWARANRRQVRVMIDSGGASPPPATLSVSSLGPIERLPVAYPAPSAEPSPLAASPDKPATTPPPKARPSGTYRTEPTPGASAANARKDCHLVSYFDTDGNQHFKTSCDGRTGN